MLLYNPDTSLKSTLSYRKPALKLPQTDLNLTQTCSKYPNLPLGCLKNSSKLLQNGLQTAPILPFDLLQENTQESPKFTTLLTVGPEVE